MTTLQEMYASLGIDTQVLAFGEHILENLKDRFAAIDETAEYNQLKVIRAMQKARVSEACLLGTTGYGYNDIGRDTLEEVYANLFHAEDALVRPQITCGTHALTIALSSILRPGALLQIVTHTAKRHSLKLRTYVAGVSNNQQVIPTTRKPH